MSGPKIGAESCEAVERDVNQCVVTADDLGAHLQGKWKRTSAALIRISHQRLSGTTHQIIVQGFAPERLIRRAFRVSTDLVGLGGVGSSWEPQKRIGERHAGSGRDRLEHDAAAPSRSESGHVCV